MGFFFFFSSRERQTTLARPIRHTAMQAMAVGLGGGNSSICCLGQRACHAMTFATEQRWKECNLAESTWIINVWKNKQSRQRSGEIVWSRHINQTCPSGWSWAYNAQWESNAKKNKHALAKRAYGWVIMGKHDGRACTVCGHADLLGLRKTGQGPGSLNE